MFIKYLLTFLISMVPVIELRGGIPFGIAEGLSIWQAFICAYIGNMLPVPFIILFIRKVFETLRRWIPKLDGLITRFENKARSKEALIKKYEVWALLIFVAIPIPGTGAWTGSLIAAMFDIRIKKAFPVIALGVLIAGIIMTLISYGVQAIFV